MGTEWCWLNIFLVQQRRTVDRELPLLFPLQTYAVGDNVLPPSQLPIKATAGACAQLTALLQKRNLNPAAEQGPPPWIFSLRDIRCFSKNY